MKQKEVSPQFYEIYNKSLRLHAHLLLAWGHKNAKSQLNTEDEEEISDILYQNIHLLLMQQPKRWMANYAVKNEDPISGIQKTGKNRREIDLIVEFTGRGRPQYVFEAKVLNWEKTYQRTPNYTNQSGMGRFMHGEYANYTARFPEVAMIGYVLSNSLKFWQEKLKTAIDTKQSQ